MYVFIYIYIYTPKIRNGTSSIIMITFSTHCMAAGNIYTICFKDVVKYV